MARVDEVLKSRREHLMLLADMFYNVGAVFLRLEEVAAVAALDRDTARDVATAVFDPSAAPNAGAAFSFAASVLKHSFLRLFAAPPTRYSGVNVGGWKLFGPPSRPGTGKLSIQSALRAVLISSAMVVLTCRWWLAVGSLATAVAFKVAEAPMEIVKTDNETLKKEVEGIAAKNMEAEFKEMNDIPNPANFTLNGNMPNASQGVWADQRVGELGKSFEFMMLKLAQLETLCELQQAELETLRKTVKGLAEHVDHPDSVASLVQKDEKARMQETQQTLKKVLAKHAQQHKNKDFHPKASRQNYRPADAKPESSKRAAEAGASDRAELLAGGAQQSGSKGSQRIFGEVAGWFGDRIEDVQSIAESTADAYSAATDKVASTSSDLLQVAFIANTAIDTVEMAVAILLKGFSDWGADCEISGPSIRDYIEECEITGSREQRSVLMALDWGRQKCKISLMGQERAQTERDLHGGDWPKGMASDALGAQDALEMRAVIQSLAEVIMVKREQQAAFRKQLEWPCLCHSMLWSAGAILGLPRWTDDAKPRDEARDRDLVQSHSAILAAAMPCSTSDPPDLPLEVKAVDVGPARQQQGRQAAKRRRRPVLLAGRAIMQQDPTGAPCHCLAAPDEDDSFKAGVQRLDNNIAGDFDPYRGVRIGEAANPGPKNSGQLSLEGLDLKAMLLPLITELIKQAVAEALGGVLPSTLRQADTRQPSPSGPGTAIKSERPKGGGKKGAKQQPQLAAEAPREAKPPQPKAPNGKGRGNPAAQPAGSGWQLVTRKPKDEGEFQLRAQDWTAPLVAYSSLGSLIDKAKPDEVIKGVIFATKPQLDTAHAMLRSSNKPYAMLHIYLDKGENARRIPGRVGDALRFRTAQVIQVNSASEHLTPDPQGLAAPVKVKSLQTSLVYVRIPKAFASEQTWKDFKSNAAKACMKWAGSHHIQGVDAFGWMEEQIKTTKSTQLFGLLRVPTADVGTLLGISGQKGIFVEPARRDTISVRLEWLPRTTKQESDEQYLQRALRGATAYGLGVFGNRIAWRHARVDGEVLPRIWTLSEVPKDWRSHEVNQLLEQGFKDITVLSHRLHKGTTTFRFRATCLAGDKDLVPLNAQVDDSGLSVVLWAALAPARTFQSQQRPLARGNVPHVPPDKSTCLNVVPSQAQASQEPTVDASGKVQPAAKRTCGATRQVPQDLERRPCAKEGDCAFLSVAEGLAWLASGGKGGGQKEFNHVELRARVASHLEKHRQEYESEWDNILPNGTKAKSFDEYLAAIRQLKQFASELELRALSRIYNVRVLIVPASDAFTPMVFHTNAKRMLVLWLEDKHLEFLRPKGENSTCKDYPEEYWKVTDGPVKSLKVGGSDATSSLRSGTVWSNRSSKAERVSGVQHLAEIRYKHCTKHHDGEGLPGPSCRKEPYVIQVTGPRKNFSWICEWCSCGVRQSVADAAREDTVARAIRAHIREAHPETPKHRQQQARMGISQGQKKRIHQWNAAVSSCFQKRAELLADGFASFVWPALITARKGKPDLRLCLPRAWRCGTCLGCFRNETRARKHKCVPAWAANNRKAKLKLLSKVREWCRRHPQLHTMPQNELKVIFTLAKLALQGRDIRMPV
ncbi:hypothetical protein AK812_SmicGene4922 [Symbiodinium microadriaticum]|uniref:OTU domain-containing protein n=1 Tax=Symbiodinium microadriaticum TaxID=2951 RepID=A0A1Q9EV58_SYMMI|nr:hypothetical protein AK812_SmicGene4922 [Symbiodinium microadriaticum]CAE7248649.1 unnamed protein product [Symbiodinium sp. KB8]